MTRDGEVAADTKKKRKLCDADDSTVLSPATGEPCFLDLHEDTVKATVVSNFGENANLASKFDEANVASASCCASNGSSDITKGTSTSLDLDVESEKSTASICNSELEDSREAISSSSKLMVEPQCAKSRRLSTVPDAELDEFFATAEKDLLNQYAQKYNFDFVKEEPLKKGRYEWIRL